jgi:hypothetical protein
MTTGSLLLFVGGLAALGILLWPYCKGDQPWTDMSLAEKRGLVAGGATALVGAVAGAYTYTVSKEKRPATEPTTPSGPSPAKPVDLLRDELMAKLATPSDTGLPARYSAAHTDITGAFSTLLYTAASAEPDSEAVRELNLMAERMGVQKALDRFEEFSSEPSAEQASLPELRRNIREELLRDAEAYRSSLPALRNVDLTYDPNDVTKVVRALSAEQQRPGSSLQITSALINAQREMTYRIAAKQF